MPRDVTLIANSPPADAAALRTQVRTAMTSLGISQAEVARRADIPPSTLSQWMNDRYPGDAGAVEEKLVKWLATQEHKGEVVDLLPRLPSYVETPTARRIIAGFQYAQSARTITLIQGVPGASKTRAARHYRSTASSVWIVTADPMLAQLAALLDQIARVLKLPDGRRDPASLRAAIIARLRGTGGLLIVDEAQHLSDKAIEAIRTIHDAVNEDVEDDDAAGLGVALIGNTVLYARIFKRQRGHDFAQVTSRIGKQVRIDGVADADIKAFAGAYQISGTDELAAVRDIARRPGGLRLVDQVLRQAWLLAAADNPPARPCLDHIHTAFTDLVRDGGAP